MSEEPKIKMGPWDRELALRERCLEFRIAHADRVEADLRAARAFDELRHAEVKQRWAEDDAYRAKFEVAREKDRAESDASALVERQQLDRLIAQNDQIIALLERIAAK